MTPGDRVELEAVPRDVLDLCERLRSQGKRAWIVGGCVRDLLLGRVANDWDVATDARPGRALASLPARHPDGHRARHGHRREGGAPLRGDDAARGGDVLRRAPPRLGRVRRRHHRGPRAARLHGERHRGRPRRRAGSSTLSTAEGTLQRGVLRAVGDPRQRFAEDGLRVLRAARFVATLELALDPATEAGHPPDARHVPQGGARARPRRVGQDDEGAPAVAAPSR